MGRTVDIDQTPLDVVDVYDSDEGGTDDGKKKEVNYGKVTTGKVRVCCNHSLSTIHSLEDFYKPDFK